jgi:Rad3-related DNA helicase
MSCVDKREIFNHYCEDCHYVNCLNKAVQGHDTFYNPLSFFYMRLREGWFFPPFIVVDEAHTIVESLRTLVCERLSKKRYRWPAYESEVQIIKWMGTFIEKLKSTCQVLASKKKVNHFLQMIDKLTRIYTALKDYSHEFKIYTEPDPDDATNTVLVIEPIKVPTDFIRSFFGKSRVLLMSATMPDYKIREIFGNEPYEKLELDSPIPACNRPIVYYPPAYQITWRTKPALIARWLDKVFTEFPGENTIVHVTYKQAEELKPFYPDAMFNTADNKQYVLEKFKKKGGIWFASGCSEGVDLPGDLCRLNIIIRLQKANIGDISVLKSRSLIGGFEDYEMASLIQLQQQVGRSTRSEDDESIIIIGDKSFKECYKRHEANLSKSFKEAILWETGIEQAKHQKGRRKKNG